MNFEQQLQSLLRAADEMNSADTQLISEVAGVIGSWAAARRRNSDDLRQRIAALAHPVPQQKPPLNGAHPAAYYEQGRGGDPRQAIDNMRRSGAN